MATPTAPIHYPTANGPDAASKERDESAVLEGHDADIPLEEKPTTSANGSASQQSPPSLPGSDDTRGKDEEQAVPSTEIRLEPEQDGDSDPNIISWDGPDDPENPVNWKEGTKWANVAAVSAFTFIT